MQTLFLATANGLFTFTKAQTAMLPPNHTLAGINLTCIWTQDNLWLAGTPTGLLRSSDDGQSWHPANTGLTIPHVRTIAAPSGQANRIFVGVEPAALFYSEDDGLTWHECPEIAQLRIQHSWYLPYSENLGCVRSFTFHGQRAYAAVEVGGVLRSDDGGRTWRLADGSDGRPHTDAAPPFPLIHPDVHSVAVDPTNPDKVWATTNGGLYRSADGGASWQRVSKDCYCRALWIDPTDTNHIIFGPATRIGWDGHIEESFDNGTTWSAAAQGIEAPWENAPIEQMIANNDTLFALRDDGQLLMTPLSERGWRYILPQVAEIQAIAVATTLEEPPTEPDENKNWNAYYKSLQGRPPRPLFVDALARFATNRYQDEKRFAIDLGCGDGTETLALLADGWQVLAIDGQPNAVEFLQEKAFPQWQSQLSTQTVDFEAVNLPVADFIYAGFSLPFCQPQHFPAFWQKIVAAIQPSGRFAGQLFGERDTWASGTEMTFHTRSQAQTLFEQFEVEHFHEVDEEGQSFNGPKHWHYYDIIARKRES